VTDLVQSVLILLCLLQVKHMFADYYLQTPKMLEGRGAYLHSGRAQHAAVHILGSLPCFLIVGTPWPLLAVLLIGEWVVHFHIDYGKARWSATHGHTPADAGFWRAAGFDQALHQLSYVAMVWIWVVAT
jgi:hypothetical protein